MQTYASKYLDISHMTSASKINLQNQLRSVDDLSPKIMNLFGHEFEVRYIWQCGASDQGMFSIPLGMVAKSHSYAPSPTVSLGLREWRLGNERLIGKVVASLRTNLDLIDLIPNLEPQICLFVFGDADIYDDEAFYFYYDLFVREDYLKSPQGRAFARDVLKAKLKGQVS